jgi:hypothetical protein
LAVLSAVIICASARASDQADQLVTGKKLIVKTDTNDSSKNKLVFVSKDTSFDLPNGSNNPTLGGATLTVIDLGGGSPLTLPLAASRWKLIGGGYKYKGQPGDPCKNVTIKDDKLIKIVCKGASVALTLPAAGSLALGLEVGTTSVRYCATFANDGKNELKPNGKGKFKKKDAPAPPACLTCGDGNLDAGEQCDDGNNTNGDCCSAQCTFEPNASPCDDGDPCTASGLCDGSGTCVSDTLCGNDVLDGSCGELCDGSDDDACPGHCLGDCSCAPEPTCVGDPSRTVYLGGPETGACHQFDGNQALCEQAFHLGNAGVASCWYDADSEICNGCGPANQSEGLCMNECRPIVCAGDPSRTAFAGGPGSGACASFGLVAGTANCDLAFHLGGEGVASCYYDADADECRGCGSANQEEGNCINECAACQADPTRVLFAGGPGTSACHQFDGDEVSCNQAFHRDQCGNDTSCFYQFGSCNGCGPNNESEGICKNTCEAGPITCTNDPSRTIDAGGPGTGACHQFDNDPYSCQQAFHRTDCNQATSCYYDYNNEQCNGCGPNNEFDGQCVNTCVGGPVACADPSRVLLAGLPGSSGCFELGQALGTAACETAYNVGSGGVASCYSDGSFCQGCGPTNEGNGNCINTCTHGAPSCDADPTRTVYAGGPNTGACQQFTDEASCEAAFHTGMCGEASCYWDGFSCNGCGPNNEGNGNCTNTCIDAACPGDPARVIYAGGPASSGCHFFDGNQTNCEKAFIRGDGGIASCYYDTDFDECRGCGPNNEDSGACVNTCPVCAADPARTTFAGGPGTAACHEFDNNQAACENAFHYDACGRPTSCYYSDSGDCNGCGPNNLANGECQNTCEVGPPTCAKDPTRTIFAGGPGTGACHQFDNDAESCLKAFHRGQNGGIASCQYDPFSGDCSGCGSGNLGSGDCLNTCLNGIPPCTQDPTRTVMAGFPNTSACHAFDGNPGGCATAYHLDQCYNAASCWYDADSETCNGCGPNNQQDGACVNTCSTGPASCDMDTSRILFGGGPGTGACFEFDDQASCLAAFHVGQCGVASCYWTGGSCQGCGPNNELSGDCFNTCEAP